MAIKKPNMNASQLKAEEVEALFRDNAHRIIPVDLEKEMKKAFIDYAMSVISDRALPDVRDGLKPVHRRILYAMYTQGFTPEKSYRKCATTVGVVLGKFHPHGDAAVYDALVRLAQDFSMRHTLVDGYGNFGSRDGDPPAAYRYTEAKLTSASMDMLSDIHKDSVDFKPNFDEHEMEPIVLPARFPNLLVNGSTGIAVGMATNIPPHNLQETVNAVIYLMKNPDATLLELLTLLPGPDFPTGGIIVGTHGIREAYANGRGRIVVRAKTEIEEVSGNKQRIIVKDLPYMVNKARVIEKIAELVKDKKIDGISYIRDESDRNEAVRIVIDLKRDVNAHVVLNQLYKMTQLQDSFNANILALVPDSQGRFEPKTLGLIDCLQHYIKHQKEVVTRRTKFDLDKAEARKHILEGLKIAFIHIDEIIELIKASAHGEAAKKALQDHFGFTERQAQHIVDIRLIRLTNLEQVKIESEFQDIMDKISGFNRILSEESRLIEVVEEELLSVCNKYAEPRRTEIEATAIEDIEDESLIQEEEIAITMSHFGYIKRQSLTLYRSQRRGGKGINGMSTREEDYVERLLTGSTHAIYLFFTNRGRVFKMKGYQIPEASRTARGTAIVNLLALEAGEKIKAIIPIKEFAENQYLFMATQKGLVKKTSLMEYSNIHKGGLIAIVLREDDNLVGVELVTEEQQIFLCSKYGMSLRFPVASIRSTSRRTLGVRGLKLREEDALIGMVAHKDIGSLLIVTENGFGKRTSIQEYPLRSRAGLGIKTYKTSEKTGLLVSVANVTDENDIIMINDGGVIIRLHADEVPEISRVTQGVTLMRSRNHKVVDVAVVERDEDTSELLEETKIEVDNLD